MSTLSVQWVMHTELRSPANISQIQDTTKTDIFGVRVQTFAILIYLRKKFLEDYIIFFPSFATATTFSPFSRCQCVLQQFS